MKKSDKSVSDQTKALLVDPLKRIELADYVTERLRDAMTSLSGERFPISGPADQEDFPKRVASYETEIADLQTISILLARWGDPEQLLLLEKIISSLGGMDIGNGGLVLWLRLSRYPLLVILYSAGIAALSARRHEALHITLATSIPAEGRAIEPVVLPVMGAMGEIADAFKLLPGHDREYVPRSQHLFESLRVPLDDALFLGTSYEFLFDRYELFIALSFADFSEAKNERIWGPIGRFSWKHHHSESPLKALIAEAKANGANWPYLRSGLFRGSLERFLQIANAYNEFLARNQRW